MGGLIKTMPITAVSFLLCAFSVMGIPPFGGFFSKYMVMSGAVQGGHLWIALTFLVGAIMTMLYLFRLFNRVFLGEAIAPAREGSPLMVACVAFLAVLGLVAGVAIQWPSQLALGCRGPGNGDREDDRHHAAVADTASGGGGAAGGGWKIEAVRHGGADDTGAAGEPGLGDLAVCRDCTRTRRADTGCPVGWAGHGYGAAAIPVQRVHPSCCGGLFSRGSPVLLAVHARPRASERVLCPACCGQWRWSTARSWPIT